ncbi:MAG: hypothetical protein KJ052_06230, partial [Candidatus Hydrogenedentes bacterium]|nr:hypothetical protein [Candidatus Hydrogenedentota bacterium]
MGPPQRLLPGHGVGQQPVRMDARGRLPRRVPGTLPDPGPYGCARFSAGRDAVYDQRDHPVFLARLQHVGFAGRGISRHGTHGMVAPSVQCAVDQPGRGRAGVPCPQFHEQYPDYGGVFCRRGGEQRHLFLCQRLLQHRQQDEQTPAGGGTRNHGRPGRGHRRDGVWPAGCPSWRGPPLRLDAYTLWTGHHGPMADTRLPQESVKQEAGRICFIMNNPAIVSRYASRRIGLSVLALITVLVSARGEVQRQAPELLPQSIRVHAFYYPWYGNPATDGDWYHWNHVIVSRDGENRHHEPPEDIGANFYPAMGLYSSNAEADVN